MTVRQQVKAYDNHAIHNQVAVIHTNQLHNCNEPSKANCSFLYLI